MDQPASVAFGVEAPPPAPSSPSQLSECRPKTCPVRPPIATTAPPWPPAVALFVPGRQGVSRWRGHVPPVRVPPCAVVPRRHDAVLRCACVPPLPPCAAPWHVAFLPVRAGVSLRRRVSHALIRA